MPSQSSNSPAFLGPIKSQLDFAGGLFLIGIAVLGFVGAFNLPFGTLSGIGSGLLPKVVAVLVGAFGVLLVVNSLLWKGDYLESWHLRGPLFVLGAVLSFAMVIRGSTLNFPLLPTIKVPGLGLVVAGPLAVIVSSFADKDTRIREVVIFAVIMTLACGVLFKELLSLPIPFDPLGIIPDFINHAYAEVRSAIGNFFTTIRHLIAG